MKILIQDNRLNIPNEIFTWIIILRWIQFNCQKRLIHFWPLFSLIRINLIRKDLIQTILVEDFVKLNYIHNNYLVQSYLFYSKYPFKIHSNDVNFNFLLQETKLNFLSFKLFNPRIPAQILMLYGGYEDGFPSNAIHTFDIRACKWFRFQMNENFSRIYHKILVNCFFLIYY